MPICIIAHEVPMGDGRFKVFEAGCDYPESEIGDRAAYFEKMPAPAEAEKEEVTEDDAT
jgi:hypothetical protein